MVINRAGPVSNKNQSKRWLLFKREIRNPAERDVSDVTLFRSVSLLFNQISFYYNFYPIIFYLPRWRGEPACMRPAKPF